MATTIMLSTISKNKKHDSYINYKKEIESESSILWTDSKADNAVVGTYFGFVFNETDTIDVYTVIEILASKTMSRIRSHWSQTERNILKLSDKISTISLTKYKETCGYSKKFVARSTSQYRFDKSLLNCIELNEMD